MSTLRRIDLFMRAELIKLAFRIFSFALEAEARALLKKSPPLVDVLRGDDTHVSSVVASLTCESDKKWFLAVLEAPFFMVND